MIHGLEMLRTYIVESKYVRKPDPSIFKDRLFWAIVSIVGGLGYFLGNYESKYLVNRTANEYHELKKEYQILLRDYQALSANSDSLSLTQLPDPVSPSPAAL